MTQPTQARRRFAPVPIETTFKEHRKGGPTSEPTPEPSPTSESPSPQAPQVVYHETQTQTSIQPQAREKRRFAPRLLESSRRSRRAGDATPATKPADKTDITPYAKHIYSLSSKKKHNRRPGHARRESCDDEIADHVFDLNKLEAQRRLEELAMLAFPNSTMRLGGAEHFIMREGSGDDDDDDDDDDDETRGRVETRAAGDKKKLRRDSSEENVNWMVKEMQKHADQLAQDRGDLDSLESASARSDGPPDNTFAFTSKARHSLEPMSPIGEHPMPYIPREPVASHPTRSAEPSYFGPAASYDAQAPPSRPIGVPHVDTDMPDAPPPRPTAPASQIPPETGFARTRGAFGRFYGYQQQDKAAEKALFRLQTRQSPPMAGRDLTFRLCPSPKETKLDPEQKWDTSTGGLVEPNRDTTGQHGLWRGYCFTQNKGAEALAPSRRPNMIITPIPPATPSEQADASATTNGTLATFPVSAEPSPISPGRKSTSEHRSRAGQPKGLHMLMGLEQRLQKEKVAADLEERIATEFNDAFVTQVYNYLSLGYPATARVYDEELSKISRISTEELEKEDDAVMGGIGNRAKGHIKISMDLDMSEDKRCPRWKALKQYIYEWARQHPDLDGITPLAWGVAERRGSWGI